MLWKQKLFDQRIAQAKKEGEALYFSRVEEAKKKARQMLTEAGEKEKEWKETALSAAEKKAEALASESQKKVPEAIRAVVDRIRQTTKER